MIYYLISTLLTIGAFIIGVNIGIKLNVGKEINIIPKLPNIPKKIKEVKAMKDEVEELKKLNLILNNIENYDGTNKSQKVVK